MALPIIINIYDTPIDPKVITIPRVTEATKISQQEATRKNKEDRTVIRYSKEDFNPHKKSSYRKDSNLMLNFNR